MLEHNMVLTYGINKLASKDSLIIHMGDMAVGAGCEYDEYKHWLNHHIKCENIWSIEGNHDNRMIKLSKESDKLTNLGFGCDMVFKQPFGCVGHKDVKHHITCCHYPLEIWNKSHHGTYHVCGHSHGTFEQTNFDHLHGRRLDVGVDTSLKFNGKVMFTLDEIVSIMKCKLIKPNDHHNEKTT